MANQYWPGQLVRLTATFAIASAAYDPDKVQFEYTDPEDATTTKEFLKAGGGDSEVVKDEDGQYHIDVDTAAPATTPHGTWYARVFGRTAADASIGALENSFRVRKTKIVPAP